MTTKPKPSSRKIPQGNHDGALRSWRTLKNIGIMGKKKDKTGKDMPSSTQRQAELIASNSNTRGTEIGTTTTDTPRKASQGSTDQHTLRSLVSREDFLDLRHAVSPHIAELIATRNELTKNFTKISEKFEKVLGIYSGRRDLVDYMQDSWEQGTQQGERIQHLEGYTKSLERRLSELAEPYEAEICKLKNEVVAERAAKDDVESHYAQVYKAREEELDQKEADLAKSTIMAEKELSLRERKFTEAHRALVTRLEDENADLLDRLHAVEDQLEQAHLEVEKNGRAYDSLRQEAALTQSSLEHMEQQISIPCQEDDFFIDFFGRIQMAVADLCCNHITELPSSAIQDSNHTSWMLRQADILFNETPISDSAVSVGLRRAKVHHLVVRFICDEIWQPCFGTAFWNQSEIRHFLTTVSSSFTDAELESRWRNLTFATSTHDPTAKETFISHLEGNITSVVRPLLTNVATFQRDLKVILTDAVDLWAAAQMDGSRITISTVPSALTWIEALPQIMPEEDLRRALSPPSIFTCTDPLFMYPEVVRSSSTQTTERQENSTVKYKTQQVRVLCHGLALFPEAGLFDLGREEQAAIAEATKQVSFRVGSRRSQASARTKIKASSHDALDPSVKTTDQE